MNFHLPFAQLPSSRLSLAVAVLSSTFCVYSTASAQNTSTLPSNSNKQKRLRLDSTKVVEIPSVTVSSNRAEERKSPVPFSEISREDIKELGAYKDIPDLLSNLPSTISYSENGNGVGYSYITMRGFDQRRISIMVNGIPQNDPSDHGVYWINMPDLASNLATIQVQRGAGLANYGAAAIGGSINLTTSNFTEEKFIRYSSGIGLQQYSRVDGSTVFQNTLTKNSLEISSGLNGKYAFYGRLSEINSLGYRDHSWADLTSYFLSAVRIDDMVTTQVNVYGGPIADGLAYYGIPKSYIQDKTLRRTNFGEDGTSPRRKQELENFSQPHFEVLNDIRLDDAGDVTIKSALFYIKGDGFFDIMNPYFDPTSLRMTPEFGYPSTTANPQNVTYRAFVSNRQYGWIPRVEIKHANGVLTLGTELRIHRSENYGTISIADNLPANFDPAFRIYSYNTERDIFSFFASERYQLSNDISLNFDGQFVYHRYAIANERAGYIQTSYPTTDGQTRTGGNLFDLNYVFFNPRAGINWNISSETNVFFSLAYTSREPRMNNFYDASGAIYGSTPLFRTIRNSSDSVVRYDFSSPLVKPERLLNLELGAAWKTSDYSLSANFYLMEFFDELVKSGQIDLFGTPITGNAPRTRHYGLEIEAGVVLARASWGTFSLSGNATLSSNKIVDYTYYRSNGEQLSLAGNSIAGFPDMMANIRATYRSGAFVGNAIVRFVGRFYTDNFQNQLNRNDEYTVLNFDASYTLGRFFGAQSLRVRAQVNNALNRLYSSNGEGESFFPAAERNIFFGVELTL